MGGMETFVATKVHQPPAYFSSQIARARRFYLDLKPSRRGPLTVVCGGCEHCTPDYEIHRSGFPYWSIEFVAQGKGKLTLNKKSHQLVAGTVFSYGPRIPQDIVTDPRELLVKYFVVFTGKGASHLLKRYGPEPGHVLLTLTPSEVLDLFESLIRNGLRNTPFTPRISAVLIEHLILKIAETAIPDGLPGTPAFTTYRGCRQRIEDRWFHLHTLEQIARECHVDPAYMCRLFHRFDHQSPYQYLLRLKMNHAAERLQVSGASVKQVADELGFSDPFHFSRTFKKVMGISPSRFVRFHRRS
jgi:AraC-like DNA-binding protein